MSVARIIVAVLAMRSLQQRYRRLSPTLVCAGSVVAGLLLPTSGRNTVPAYDKLFHIPMLVFNNKKDSHELRKSVLNSSYSQL
jgi:hypothetical protein